MSRAHPTDFAVERRALGPLASNLGNFSDVAGKAFGQIDEVLVSTAHATMGTLAGLSPQGAAALAGSALGCSASTIDAYAREELRSWLAGQTGITGPLKPLLQSWCESKGFTTLGTDVVAALSVHIPTYAQIAAKGSLYITVDGIFAAGELQEAFALGTSDQESLSGFISAHDSLSADIHAGLSLCAAGGTFISLDAHFKASLLAWTQASNCPLSANLQRSVLAWCQGSRSGDLTLISSSDDSTLVTTSVGASVGAFVEEGGPLSAHAQAALRNFLDTSLATDIDASALAGLTACAAGSYATSIDVGIRTAVAAWLTSSRYSLGVELKAIVFLWLSRATPAETSISLVSSPLVDIAGLPSEDALGSLSTSLRAALGLVRAGGSLSLLSWGTRAELAAFLSGCTTVKIGPSPQLILTEWFTGCSISDASFLSLSVSGLASSTFDIASTDTTTSAAVTRFISASCGSFLSCLTPSTSLPTGPALSVPSSGGLISTSIAPSQPEIKPSSIKSIITNEISVSNTAPLETGFTDTQYLSTTVGSPLPENISSSGSGLGLGSESGSGSSTLSYTMSTPTPTQSLTFPFGGFASDYITTTVTATKTVCECEGANSPPTPSQKVHT